MINQIKHIFSFAEIILILVRNTRKQLWEVLLRMIAWSSVKLLYFYIRFLIIHHQLFTPELQWLMVGVISIPCLCSCFSVIFSITLTKLKFCKVQFLFFLSHIDWAARYLVHMFICLFLYLPRAPIVVILRYHTFSISIFRSFSFTYLTDMLSFGLMHQLEGIFFLLWYLTKTGGQYSLSVKIGRS